MDKVITFSFGEDFIQKTATFITENLNFNKNDFSRLAVVFGGKRPELFLKKELAGILKKSFLPPRFFSMDDFVGFIVSQKGPFSRINELDASFLLYNIARKKLPQLLKDRESFSKFLPWAKELLAFLEHLELEDIPTKSLENIQANASIGYEVPDSINVLLKHIVSLRDAFNQALMNNKTYTRGLIYKIAADCSQDIALAEFDQIIFGNQFYLHRTETNLLKHLYDQDKAMLFFQKDEKEWSVFKKIEEDFSCRIEPDTNIAARYDLNIYAGFDSHSQICMVREVLKKIKDLDKTIIVLPQPQTIVPLLSEIATLVKDFNVSIGYPIKRSSLYSLFELIFAAQESKNDEKYYTKDYLRAMSHPLIKNLAFGEVEPQVTRVLTHKVEEILIGEEENPLAGSLFISLQELQDTKDIYETTVLTLQKMEIEQKNQELKGILKKIHGLLFYAWEDISDFSGFCSALESFLDFLISNSFLENYPLNLLICDKLFIIINELKNSSFNQEPFDKKDIFKIFLNHLENQRFSFSGSPLKGLQILGLLESRSLNFENVIVMDMNERLMPALKIYEPLIPRGVMLGLGLNRLEKEDEIQRYQFMRLIGGAKNIYLIYDSGIEKEKSRFLEELIWQRQKESKTLDVITVRKSAFQINLKPPKQEITKTEGIIEFLKNRSYSASSINTYLNCPLRFYYEYVLGLKEKEDLLEDPEAADIGNFVHEFLQEAFLKFKGKKPLFDAKFRQYFFELLDKKFEAEFSRKMKSDSFLLKEILQLRMKNFFDNESERAIEKLVCLEEEEASEVSLNCGKFNFKYRIDRVDQMLDKSLLVIDYKTGSTDLKPASLDRIQSKGFTREVMKKTVKSFQLPLYFYFVNKKYPAFVINAAFYNLSSSSIISFLKQDDLDQKDKVIDVFLKGLEGIFSELLDPKITFCADEENSNYCQICPFFYLCR